MFVSPTLKKYAKEKELKISKGFVYGEIDGYMVTIAEGVDIKILSISCKTCGNEKLAEYLDGLKLKKDYYITDYKIFDDGIQVVFAEVLFCIPVVATPKIKKFLTDIIPVLKENGVNDTGTCAVCMEPINAESDTKIMLKNGFAHKVCSSCIEKMSEDKTEIKSEKNNVVRGTVGALVGGTFGYIVLWAVLLLEAKWLNALIGNTGCIAIIAFVASMAGLLILRGYRLFGGKACKTGVVSVAVCHPISYFLGYLLMNVLYFSGATVNYFIKNEMPLEIQEVFRKIARVLIAFFTGDTLFEERVFLVLSILIILLSLCIGFYGVLREYINKNLKVLKKYEVLE